MRKQLPLVLILLLFVGIIPVFAQQAVTSFTLINADTDKPIKTLVNGDVINYATIGTRNINIVANTTPSQVGSVVFVLNSNKKVENMAPYTFAGDNVSSTSVNYYPISPVLAAGSYTLKATPYSSSNGSGTIGTSLGISFNIVEKTSGNSSPTANAGPDKTLTLPTNSTSLSGSGSDPDGSIASYTWTKTSGPSATLSNTTSKTLSVSNMVAGTYVFRLTVKDNLGATGFDDAVVTVQSSTSSGGSTGSCTAFNEQNSLVVMEVESQPTTSDWSKRTSVSGYTGSAYYEWRSGNTSTGTVAAGTGTITYTVKINNPGRYRLQIRSAAPQRTEHNDVWVRFPEGKAIGIKGTSVLSLGANWFKVYHNVSNNSWTWETKTKDHDPHDIFVDFSSAGTYRVQISGRSSQFKVDRLVLYRSSVSSATALSTSTPQSSCAGASTYATIEEESTPAVMFGAEVRDHFITQVMAYPNPSQGSIYFDFTSAKAGKASIQIFDIKGSLIETVFDAVVEAGEARQTVFEGSHLPKGMYVARLITPDKVVTKQLIFQ